MASGRNSAESALAGDQYLQPRAVEVAVSPSSSGCGGGGKGEFRSSSLVSALSAYLPSAAARYHSSVPTTPSASARALRLHETGRPAHKSVRRQHVGQAVVVSSGNRTSSSDNSTHQRQVTIAAAVRRPPRFARVHFVCPFALPETHRFPRRRRSERVPDTVRRYLGHRHRSCKT